MLLSLWTSYIFSSCSYWKTIHWQKTRKGPSDFLNVFSHSSFVYMPVFPLSLIHSEVHVFASVHFREWLTPLHFPLTKTVKPSCSCLHDKFSLFTAYLNNSSTLVQNHSHSLGRNLFTVTTSVLFQLLLRCSLSIHYFLHELVWHWEGGSSVQSLIKFCVFLDREVAKETERVIFFTSSALLSQSEVNFLGKNHIII